MTDVVQQAVQRVDAAENSLRTTLSRYFSPEFAAFPGPRCPADFENDLNEFRLALYDLGKLELKEAS